ELAASLTLMLPDSNVISLGKTAKFKHVTAEAAKPWLEIIAQFEETPGANTSEVTSLLTTLVTLDALTAMPVTKETRAERAELDRRASQSFAAVLRTGLHLNKLFAMMAKFNDAQVPSFDQQALGKPLAGTPQQPGTESD